MNSEKYIGLDVHQATISVAVLDETGKLIIECILETKAATILEFFAGLCGTLAVTFEEGTSAGWLYDLLTINSDRTTAANWGCSPQCCGGRFIAEGLLGDLKKLQTRSRAATPKEEHLENPEEASRRSSVKQRGVCRDSVLIGDFLAYWPIIRVKQEVEEALAMMGTNWPGFTSQRRQLAPVRGGA